MGNQEIIKVAKLDDNLTCNICGGELIKISAKEAKKLLKMNLEGKIFKCEKCEIISRITITAKTRVNDSLQWSEEIERVHSWELKERLDLDDVEKISSQEVKIEEIGKIFKCEKNGIECDLYYLASCGLGDPEICGPDRKCKYDPYTEKEKRKWYKSLV